MSTPQTPVRVAVLDLYDNEPNEGMRAIREILAASDRRYHGVPVTFDVFEARYRAEVPGLDYDVYVSSGGPGSPFDGEGKPWETAYFNWLERVWAHNSGTKDSKKYVFFICHSFQMMCRFFELGEVTQRRSPSFGILPVHLTEQGRKDWLFEGLPDPFYAADFRSWQVVQPHRERLRRLGARILALEKIRPHVDLERAVMAIRVSGEIVGTQFHPEADPPGMTKHFLKPERRAYVIEHHGEEKYRRILRRLQEPNALTRTHNAVLPNFIRHAVTNLRPEQALRRVA
ncbi:hypothetical protein GQ464_000240 [Rhodocaloribacter litoris]|uniref:type 1 glutamine amidotransferase n=1 Tax=Rhodocaloribacter litoris TaxID=2558931 RepID=UPI0014228E3B|nr:GMP synthase [Rhodocaloribacter litoris]QXD15423.1 hypothetical protein GQ464_000240 [Rhodocaloribacter litoris]